MNSDYPDEFQVFLKEYEEEGALENIKEQKQALDSKVIKLEKKVKIMNQGLKDQEKAKEMEARLTEIERSLKNEFEMKSG